MKNGKPYFSRVVPAISTSSKKFVDGRTRSRGRRALKRALAKELQANRFPT